MTAGDAGPVTFLDVELEGRSGQCVQVVDGVVAYAGPSADRPAATEPPLRGRRPRVVAGAGGALLPGLHDHHLHLLAAAAAGRSVDCGPPSVVDRAGLGRVLRAAAAAVPPGTWVRGTGVDETVVGPLDAAGLDALLGPLADRPVRVRHRGGHRWVLDGAAAAAVGGALARGALDGGAFGAGTDLARGVVHGGDRVLRSAWPGDRPPPLDGVGSVLAALGCTGVTDASVDADGADVDEVVRAQAAGALPQRVRLLGRAVPDRSGCRAGRGEVKVVLEDADLPSLDELVAIVRAAGGRGVAVHCVGQESLVLAAAALGLAGGGPHRIEHASVATPGAVALVASLPVAVVTQPGFVAAHGDRYRREVDPGDIPWLYRLRGWLAAGVPLAGSSDAPYGPLDPWVAMRAAVTRRTAGGAVLGSDERLTPEQALGLYLGPLAMPGGPTRRVVAGAPGDLCLLSAGWSVAREELDAGLVRSTYCAGVAVHGE